MPGQRILWTVTMKFNAVRIDENPVMKMPRAAATTYVFEYMLL